MIRVHRLTMGIPVFERRVKRIPRPFPAWVWAVTVWPLILLEPQAWDRPDILAHERYHAIDQLRWVWLPWFVAYFLLMPFFPETTKHPLERRAYEIQRQVRAAMEED